MMFSANSIVPPSEEPLPILQNPSTFYRGNVKAPISNQSGVH